MFGREGRVEGGDVEKREGGLSDTTKREEQSENGREGREGREETSRGKQKAEETGIRKGEGKTR